MWLGARESEEMLLRGVLVGLVAEIEGGSEYSGIVRASYCDCRETVIPLYEGMTAYEFQENKRIRFEVEGSSTMNEVIPVPLSNESRRSDPPWTIF